MTKPKLYANDGRELRKGDIALFKLPHGTKAARIDRILSLGTVDVTDAEGQSYRLSGLRFYKSKS